MKTEKLLQPNWIILAATILFVISLLLLGGCNSSTPTQPASPSTEPVVVQLSWLHTIEFAAFYEAKDRGYYTDESLEVEFHSGGFDADGNSIDSIGQVVSGEADFGLTDGAVLLTARTEGTPVVAIASVYQRSPIAFVSLAENDIKRPEDLVGATVHLDSYTSGVIYQALLASQDIDPTQVNQVSRVDFTTAALLSGEADVIDGWVTNEAVGLDLEGHDINIILASDYGIDIYPNVIFTTEDMIKNNPALVERFLRATIHGMQDAIENSENAAKLAVTYDDTLNLEHETAAMFKSLPLLNPSGSQPGMMTTENWKIAQEFLVDQGILSESLDVEAAYTLEFIDKVYAQ